MLKPRGCRLSVALALLASTTVLAGPAGPGGGGAFFAPSIARGSHA